MCDIVSISNVTVVVATWEKYFKVFTYRLAKKCQNLQMFSYIIFRYPEKSSFTSTFSQQSGLTPSHQLIFKK